MTMTRTIKNVGPAVVGLTLALITTGGLAMAAGSSGSTSTAAASSPSMLNPSIYGTGIGYDTKANTPIGEYKMAVKFKAGTTSPLKSVKFVQRGGPVYSAGSGGTMTVSVRADDGAGHPSATSLAQQSYTPGNPGGAWEKYDAVTFPSPPTLTAGTIYYVVFINPDTNNYISVNNVYVYNAPATPRQPMFSDSEFGVLYTTGSWGAPAKGLTSPVDLTYADGTHDGQSYYEAMIANYANISGASKMARERFTVAGGDKTVNSASLRLRRSGGTSPLTMTLENSSGSAIESVTVPAASIPVSSPGGDNGGSVWVTANFTSPHVLSNGAGYNLRMSTASDTTYTTFPVRAGTAKGLGTYAFSGGAGQSTTNGSSWTDLYAYDHQDLQFYFGLAASAPSTTTTTTPPVPPPTTTTTTPPPTTTTTTPPVTTTTTPPVTTTTITQVAPDWMSSQVPAGAVGVDYSFQYDATGTPKPTYALTAGLLPPGLTLTPSGVLAGKPTTAGSFTFTVSAQNGVAPDAIRERTIVVSPAATPTTATATSLQCPLVVSPTVGQTVVCTYR